MARHRFATTALTGALLLVGCATAPQTPQAQQGTLAGTSWTVVQFEGGDGTVVAAPDPTRYTIEFAPDGRAAVRIDCNRGTSTWTSSAPGHLELGPLALTRVLCPPAALNDRLARDWEHVRSYVLRDGHLFLSLQADAGIYELAAAE